MSEQGPKIEYEKTDADLRSVTKVGIGLAVVATVVSLALLPLMKGMVAYQAKSDVAPPPIPGFEPGRQAPEPRLQGEPFADWLTLKARQEALLESYGWVDESGGVARIPIERAMKMVVERGLPVRPAAGAAAAPAASPSPTPAPGGHR